MATDTTAIHQAFNDAGLEINKAGYSITPYSLNTKLSFRFDGLKDFISFLELDSTSDAVRIEEINQLIVKEGINPESFFYVNFFNPKVAEL
jgi:hypothetical protein